MLNIAIEAGSLIVAGGILVVLIEGAAKRQAVKITARLDRMEESLSINNTNLGYDLDKLVTVDHIAQLQKSIKKELSRKKAKKSKGKRRKR